MTKELRERFDKKFQWIGESMSIMSKGDHGDGHAYDAGSYGILSAYELSDVFDFLEQEIIEVERRMKERCLEAVDRWDGGYPSNHSIGPKFCFTPEIKSAISSLK